MIAAPIEAMPAARAPRGKGGFGYDPIFKPSFQPISSRARRMLRLKGFPEKVRAFEYVWS